MAKKAAKKATKKAAKRTRKTAKRGLIDTGTDKRYVRRTASGQFKESDDVGRVSGRRSPQEGEEEGQKRQGDRGDR